MGFAGAILTFSATAAPIIDGEREFLARAKSERNAVINPNAIKMYLGLIFTQS
jgi:hypothetical protein